MSDQATATTNRASADTDVCHICKENTNIEHLRDVTYFCHSCNEEHVNVMCNECEAIGPLAVKIKIVKSLPYSGTLPKVSAESDEQTATLNGLDLSDLSGVTLVVIRGGIPQRKTEDMPESFQEIMSALGGLNSRRRKSTGIVS